MEGADEIAAIPDRVGKRAKGRQPSTASCPRKGRSESSARRPPCEFAPQTLSTLEALALPMYRRFFAATTRAAPGRSSCVLTDPPTICQPYPIALCIESCSFVVTVCSNYKGVTIYVRHTKSRGTGPYFQLVASHRVEGNPRTSVLVHLGEHLTPEDALGVWPSRVEHLQSIGRDGQAEKLKVKLYKLRDLVGKRSEAGEEQGADG